VLEHRTGSILLCALGLAFVLSMAACQIAPPAAQFNAASVVAPALAAAIEWKTAPAVLDEGTSVASTLTLSDATMRALHADPRIQAALTKVRVAQAEAHQTRLLPNPVLTVVVRLATAGGQPAVEASLAADLLAYVQRPGRINAADRRLRAASADALTAVVEAWADVQERFLAIQLADARVRLLEESQTATARYLGLAENRLRVGEAIRLDVSSLRTQRLDLELELADVRLERRRERLTLQRLIGQPSADASWSAPPLTDPFHGQVNERQALRAALENRPDLQSKLWELAALGVDARLARWYLLEGIVPSVEAERDPDWGVGPALEIPLPIFDWGQARRAKADAQVLQARQELLDARRRVVEETRKALAALDESRATLKRVREELIPLQRQRRDDAEAGYQAGLSDVTSLLLAERDLQDTLSKYAELQQRAHAALIDLQRAVGGPAVLFAITSDTQTMPAQTQAVVPASAPSR
jgi:outer membrane protein TolC